MGKCGLHETERQDDKMNPTDMVTELMIPRDAIAPLFKKFSFVRGELSGLLMIPEAMDEKAMAEATAWWETQTPEERMVMHSVLAALAGPQLIADISMMSGSSTLQMTRLIMDSRKPEDPVFLLGEDTTKKYFRIERLLSRDLAINTLILHIAGTDPVLSDAILKFDLPREELYVLTAVIDLYRRLIYNSLMNHLPVPASFGLVEIEKSVSDSYTSRDIRWLLPFILSVIPRKHTPLSGPGVRRSLARLLELKLVVKNESPDQYSWTEPGRLLADSLAAPAYRIGLLLTGAMENGDIAMQSLILARGDSNIWLVDLGSPKTGSSFLSTVTLRDVRSVLEGILRPSGTPRPLSGAGIQEHTGEPDTATALQAMKPQPVRASDKVVAFCRNCGSPITPGKKFCSNCGTTTR